MATQMDVDLMLKIRWVQRGWEVVLGGAIVNQVIES